MKKKWKQKQKQKKYRVIPSFQTIAAPPPVESLSFWTDIFKKRDMTVDSSLHFSKSQLKRARSAKMAACDSGCDVNLASAFS